MEFRPDFWVCFLATGDSGIQSAFYAPENYTRTLTLLTAKDQASSLYDAPVRGQFELLIDTRRAERVGLFF